MLILAMHPVKTKTHQEYFHHYHWGTDAQPLT